MDIHLSDNGASTADKVHEREEFRVLVDDIHELPETQRTALVLREMDALSYEQIAEAMETTVSSVKSLLVRARVSLAEAAEARLLSCEEVRVELGEVAEGLRRRPTPLVRRHLRSCKRCSSFRLQLRETNKALTALLPIGPVALLVRKLALVHLGHSAGAGAGSGATGASAGAAGQAAAVSGTAAAGATAAVGSAGGILSAGIGAIATKAAAGLAAAALVTAGAVEVSQRPGPTRVAATHHHPAVLAPAPPPPPPAIKHSAPSFQSTVVEIRPKKSDSVQKAAAKKADAAPAADKPVNKAQAKTTQTAAPTTTTATTTTPAPTPPPGRSQTETDPTVLPPPAEPAASTPQTTATTAPPTTTGTSTPSDTGSGETSTAPSSTTPTTTTPPPSSGSGQPTGDGSGADGSAVPPASPVVGDPILAPAVSFSSGSYHHRHRHHAGLTW